MPVEFFRGTLLKVIRGESNIAVRLSDAIFNYLLHLGWNDGTEKEIYSKEEAIKAFDISRCGKSPSRFDFEKLKNINLHYIKELPDDILFNKIAPFLEGK